MKEKNANEAQWEKKIVCAFEMWPQISVCLLSADDNKKIKTWIFHDEKKQKKRGG